MKNKLFAMVYLFLMISSCKKETTSLSQSQIFDLQTQTFSYQNADNVITIIRFGTLPLQYGNSGNKITNIPVSIYTGNMGGILGFNNPVPQNNYIHRIDTISYTASFIGDKIVLSNGQQISVQESGDLMGHLSSLTYNGITYSPDTLNMTYGVATYGQIGLWLNILNKEGHICQFISYVNGVMDTVSWSVNNNVDITIHSSNGLNITGVIENQNYATPIIEATDGNEYIICFYNLDGTSQSQCTCTMNFKLYMVSAGEKQNSNQKDLSIGYPLIVSRN